MLGAETGGPCAASRPGGRLPALTDLKMVPTRAAPSSGGARCLYCWASSNRSLSAGTLGGPP